MCLQIAQRDGVSLPNGFVWDKRAGGVRNGQTSLEFACISVSFFVLFFLLIPKDDLACPAAEQVL